MKQSGIKQIASYELAKTLGFEVIEDGQSICIGKEGVTIWLCANWFEAYSLLIGISIGRAMKIGEKRK